MASAVPVGKEGVLGVVVVAGIEERVALVENFKAATAGCRSTEMPRGASIVCRNVCLASIVYGEGVTLSSSK